tara:strand:- start:2681 stop:2884 length:204 start_codon:yes stop_codon:yes gene_type:complete
VITPFFEEGKLYQGVGSLVRIDAEVGEGIDKELIVPQFKISTPPFFNYPLTAPYTYYILIRFYLFCA